ncbi:MAG: hypothetical protein ABFR02_02410 [Campylobacterota bacterium]
METSIDLNVTQSLDVVQPTINYEILGLTLYLPDVANLNWFAVAYSVGILLINFGLYIFAPRIIKFFNSGKENKFQLTILRSVNMLFIVLSIIDYIISFVTDAYSNYFSGVAYTLLVIYVSSFIYNVLSLLSRKKFGREKEIDGTALYIDTYNSRLVDILAMVVIIFIAIYMVINAWGMTSMLETTGLLGLIVAFMALTNSIWAPDPYYCMVILSSDMLEDGDVVHIEGMEDTYIISRVTFIYTLLYNTRTNHRTLVRNSKLIELHIDNLTKKASTDGLRHSLTFKIGYPEVGGTLDMRTQKPDSVHKFLKDVDLMFAKVAERAKEDDVVKVNPNIELEWMMTNTGDYALEFTLVYFLDNLPKTKLTRKIRKHIVGTRNRLVKLSYEASVEHGISLATPDLITIEK